MSTQKRPARSREPDGNNAVIDPPSNPQSVLATAAPSPWLRFVGLDIHKEYVTIVVIDRSLNILISIKKMEWPAFGQWAQRNLTQTDAVVIEMTGNTWTVHDMLVNLVGLIYIVHPPNVADLMKKRGVKTDVRDAFELAKLLATGYLEDKYRVWAPPQAVRELRTLTKQRYKLVRMRTQAKNRLHAVLTRHHIAPPDSTLPFSAKRADFWKELPGLSPAEKLEVKLNWDTVRFAEQAIDELHEPIAAAAIKDPAIAILVQLPGIALDNAATLVAAIGDIGRFKKPRRLVGYAGLGSRVEQSGDKLWRGPITKKGRKELRYVMVDAATHAVKYHKRWKKEFAALTKRMPEAKAYVVIARKLLIVVWHILTGAESDRDGDPQQIAASYIKLFYDIGPKNLKGRRVMDYVREQMDDLGVGAELKTVFYGKTRYLPPSRHDPEGEVATPARDTRPPEYPPFGCASMRPGPDPRTFEGRLLTGRSKPEGAKKKRPLASERKKAPVPPDPTG
jgi:transposase